MKKKLNIVVINERARVLDDRDINLLTKLFRYFFSVARRCIKIKIDTLTHVDRNSVPFVNCYCDRLARIFTNGNATCERRSGIISERTNGGNRDESEVNERG